MTPLRILLTLTTALLLSACAKSEPTPEPSTTTAPTTIPSGPRIVSTVPAATYNLTLIHATDTLVGISKYDQPFLPDDKQNLPIVGDYLSMNYETLIALHPTAIIVQYAPARIPDRLKDLSTQYHFDIVNIKLDTTKDIWGTVETLGTISGHAADATKAIADARDQLHLLDIALKNRPHPKVVYIVERSPIAIAGAGSFLDEMVTLAGGNNVGQSISGLYPAISKETLVTQAPDVLLISAPSQTPQTPDDSRLDEWKKLPIPAAWNNHIFLVTDGNAMVASVNLPNQVQDLAKLIQQATPTTTTSPGGPP